jgi:hypothetical protein
MNKDWEEGVMGREVWLKRGTKERRIRAQSRMESSGTLGEFPWGVSGCLSPGVCFSCVFS